MWVVLLAVVMINVKRLLMMRAGPYYPLGTTGTVPRAYEGMEEKIKVKK
jgi:hypothetical protein